MKNIILVDRVDLIIESILENTDWTICVLVVQDEVCKKKYISNPRINEIYTATEFYYLDASSYIDFADIEKLKKEFRMLDSGMNRQRADYQYTRYNFYMGIAIWRKIFSSYTVDMCLLTEIMHGITYDSLMCSFADMQNIPCYNIYPCSQSNFVVYSCRKNDLILFDNTCFDTSKNIISDTYYYPEYISDNDKKKCRNLKQKCWRLLYQFGGSVLLQTVLCVKNRSMSFVWYPGMKESKNIVQYLIRFIEMKLIQRENDKYSVKADFNKNYVVYFLHFEPEATVTHNATIMDSQLIIIKMLASSLPDGWKLYVKEHPYTRKCNKNGDGYFIEFLSVYGSRWFFNMIRDTENVEFINVNESATDLIKHSRACATIVGTITKECVIERKPCLLFGDAKRNIFSREKDFFFIESSKECKKALQMINKGFVPEYKNIEKISCSYSIAKDYDWLKIIIKAIDEDFRKEEYQI